MLGVVAGSSEEKDRACLTNGIEGITPFGRRGGCSEEKQRDAGGRYMCVDLGKNVTKQTKEKGWATCVRGDNFAGEGCGRSRSAASARGSLGSSGALY
eukprot:scaffold587_cov339-Pavlova_lutheri.AAC.51